MLENERLNKMLKDASLFVDFDKEENACFYYALEETIFDMMKKMSNMNEFELKKSEEELVFTYENVLEALVFMDTCPSKTVGRLPRGADWREIKSRKRRKKKIRERMIKRRNTRNANQREREAM